jgi:hypothetical protein
MKGSTMSETITETVNITLEKENGENIELNIEDSKVAILYRSNYDDRDQKVMFCNLSEFDEIKNSFHNKGKIEFAADLRFKTGVLILGRKATLINYIKISEYLTGMEETENA